MFFALAFAGIAQNAHADVLSLGIYPPLMQIHATPPTFVQSPFTVTNSGSVPIYLKIVVRPFTQSDNDNGQPQYLVMGQKIGEDPRIFQRMSVFDGTQNTDNITLAPQEKKNLELRINLPQGEPAGDYYFSITMLSNPVATGQNSGAAIAGGISTNVLLSIGPQGDTTGYIQNFSAPFFLTQGPVPFILQVANTSKHFINPEGTIIVKDMFGKIIGKVTIRQDTLVLANTSRYLTDTMSYANPPKTPHPVALWPQQFLLGPYSATLDIALSNQGPAFHQTIYFLALPVQMLVGIFLAIILVSIITYRVKKRLQ